MHPASNGLVERCNASLKKMLGHVLNSKDAKNWDKKIQFLLWSYRSSPHSSTGLSPYQLVYGKMSRGPMSVLQETWGGGDVDFKEKKLSNTDYFAILKEDLQVASDIAEKNCAKAQENYVGQYNKKSTVSTFNVGDLVLILIPDSSHKIISQWHGPAVVTAILSPNIYRVASDNGSVRTLHANDLRLYISRVNSIGVIFENDSDMGEINFCPIKNDVPDSVAEIKKLDLSFLPTSRAKELRDLLLRHASVFNDKPGSCKTFQHQINLKEGFEPKRQRAYRIPEKLKPEINRQ